MAERHSIEGSEPPVKRRKIRKGTKSCWECEPFPSSCFPDGLQVAVHLRVPADFKPNPQKHWRKLPNKGIYGVSDKSQAGNEKSNANSMAPMMQYASAASSVRRPVAARSLTTAVVQSRDRSPNHHWRRGSIVLSR